VEAGITAGWTTEELRAGQEIFSFRERPNRLRGPPIFPSEYQELFPGLKQPEREAGHSPPSSAEVKYRWSYTSTFPYFMTWCLIKHGCKFTLHSSRLLLPYLPPIFYVPFIDVFDAEQAVFSRLYVFASSLHMLGSGVQLTS
jgi:hypothetical protein